MKSRIILHSFESLSFELFVSPVSAAELSAAAAAHSTAPLIDGGVVPGPPPPVPVSKWIVTVGALFPPAIPGTSSSHIVE